MRKRLALLLLAFSIIATGCGNSFFAAQDYFTGPVSGVGLKKSTTIVSGGSEQLYAIVAPAKTANKKVTWSSSNTADVTVDSNGLVKSITSVGYGETKSSIITVTTEEGGYTSACTITVVEKPIAVTGVSLSKTVSYMETGKNETLSAQIYPSTATNQTVTWSSNNSPVATIDSSTGEIIALSAGSATITVKTADGGFTSTCKITVTTTPIAVTSITLNKNITYLTIGGSETLYAVITPSTATNQNITWTSSNTSVAACDAFGNITGKSTGTAEITATASDTTNGTLTAKATVNVSASLVSVAGISLPSSIDPIAVGTQGQITATITPLGATNQNVTWASSNTAIATVGSSGIVTGLTQGTVTITATSQDGNFTAQATLTVASVPTYAVTYNGNGSTAGVPPTTESFAANSTVIIKGNIGTTPLSKTGKVFAGWNTNMNATVALYTPGSALTMSNAAITLYAIWTDPVKYTVTYIGFMSTGGVPPVDSATYSPGDTVTVLDRGSVYRDNHSFAGWYYNSQIYALGGQFTMPSANVILIPAWNPQLSITFNRNASDAIGVMTDQGILNGETGNLKANSFSRANYTFAGWATSKYGKVVYTDQQSITMGASNITLYAQWYWTDGSLSVGSTGPGGGLIFCVNATYATDGWRYLEAAPTDAAGSTTMAWCSNQLSSHGSTAVTTSGVGDCIQNTQNVVAEYSAAGLSATAALACVSYSNNGYTDWVLPSIDELQLMFTNLFSNGLGGFRSGSNVLYWSSTEVQSAWWYQYSMAREFASGSSWTTYPANFVLYDQYSMYIYVRPVRRF